MLILEAFVAGLTILFVLAPLLGWSVRPAFETSARLACDNIDDLRAQRRQILASIKDLDLEFAVGKLTQPDYEQAREELSREAIAVYRRLDEDADA
ncbi:MAG: hypothetical protein ACE5HU_05090 [Acidobacteriota bacterium]